MNANKALGRVLSRVAETAHFQPDAPPSNVNDVGSFGDTPLIIAISWNDADAISVLIQNGADVNFVGEMGNTALHKAALMGNAKAVEVLLNNGANPLLRNAEGRTPIDIAEARRAAAQDRDEFAIIVEMLARRDALWH